MSTRKTRPPGSRPPPDADTGGANQSVSVSVSILEAMASAGAPLGVTELAKRLNESKGRTHRHLSTLRALGLVAQDEVSERYFLGWKVFRLGMAAAGNFSATLATAANPSGRQRLNRLREFEICSKPAAALRPHCGWLQPK